MVFIVTGNKSATKNAYFTKNGVLREFVEPDLGANMKKSVVTYAAALIWSLGFSGRSIQYGRSIYERCSLKVFIHFLRICKCKNHEMKMFKIPEIKWMS